MRFINLLISLFLSVIFNQAIAADRAFVLFSNECILTKQINNSIKAATGANVDLFCSLTSSTLKCGQSKDKKEDYNLLTNENEEFGAQSKSGNIFLIGSLSKRWFTTASTHIANDGTLLTKHCIGKIK